ncbi:MAG: alanine--tRNA ligase [Chloroflexi bacterium]|nr:alanine--tRNA ligase [Chloroflexota bacterium]
MPSRTQPRTSDEVRRAWVEFFAERGHVQQPSSSLVPYNDPSVLLTTAGMQQMIPYMLGREAPPAIRMTSVQKCFRTVDIDEVGNPRNLTFFEMLGNFSIGDYFKEMAIPWAWEFVTEWLQFPPEHVWITIHPTDDEALGLWLATGIPRERISYLEDNWWGPPGAEGPCGPDSELYYDQGAEVGCGRPDCAPGCDCDRFLEFWNLVFMQFYQDRDGRRTPLAKKNIDTGSGLERVTAILQSAPSVYETDLFRPIIDTVATIASTAFGRDEHTDYALRVIADHGRGITFLAGDGVTPSNEGRGYVMRRIVRRAVRYGRLLGIERPFLQQIVERVIDRMGEHYPDLVQRRAGIVEAIALEEARFAETLAAGTERLNEWIAAAKERGERQVDGHLLFQLYDTFGFPRELSEEMLAEAGLEADRAGFDEAMEAQRTRSRAGARFRSAAEVLATEGPTGAPASLFQHGEPLKLPSEVVAIGVHIDGVGLDWTREEIAQGERGEILLSGLTPFYPEGGGQVGDQGVIRGRDGVFRVRETRRLDELHVVHIGEMIEGQLSRVTNLDVIAEVDPEYRTATTRHHTLTHILHRTLKDVLGENTEQKGSLVAPRVARFDFNYPRGLTSEQVTEVNARINRHVLENLTVAWQVMDITQARRAGAVAIFGEKYGSQVRVVDIGGWSKELCGGTHVDRSAEVGTAILVRESGLASGIRRVEVLAGEAAFAHAWEQQERLLHLARTVGAPLDHLEARLASLVEELDQAKREASRLEQQLAGRRAEQLLQSATAVGEVSVLAVQVEASSRDALRDTADQLRAKLGTSVVALAANIGEQHAFVVGVSRDAIQLGINAGDILREALAAAGGKGGGRPDFAQGGVKDPAQLGLALAQVVPLVERAVGRM